MTLASIGQHLEVEFYKQDFSAKFYRLFNKLLENFIAHIVHKCYVLPVECDNGAISKNVLIYIHTRVAHE